MSPYLRRLRELVGNELLVLPSVAVIPRDDEGRVLLVLHADNGQWGTIGGMIEPDERPRDAGRREALEEAAVTVELTRLVTALGGPEFRARYANGDETAYVSIVYEAAVVDGEPTPDGTVNPHQMETRRSTCAGSHPTNSPARTSRRSREHRSPSSGSCDHDTDTTAVPSRP